MNLSTQIADNWNTILAKVEEFCTEHSLMLPTIIAVSKTKPIEYLEAGIDCGIQHFGENYTQELADKYNSLGKQAKKVYFHFIGHLQSNKIKFVQVASYIHTIDRAKILNKLHGYSGQLLIQFKTPGEESKFGVTSRDSVVALQKHAQQLGLHVNGIMTIGSSDWSSDERLQHFQSIAHLQHELFPGGYFSVGMSQDWQTALLAGSTHLRIGTAIFGRRNYQK